MSSVLSSLVSANQINLADRTISGVVEAITFRNEQNGYFVARVRIAGIAKDYPIVGVAPAISVGEHLEAEGQWDSKSKYGLQFKATAVRLSLPLDEAGLAKYLAGALKGIGPVYAEKLAKTFGAKFEEVMAHEPHRLSEVPGIGPTRAKVILETWNAREDHARTLIWLCGLGMSMAFAKAIQAEYGARTRSLVANNPYQLAQVIRGIGFKKADAIALKLGLSLSNTHRLQAALRHTLGEAAAAGSCGLPRATLLATALKLLGFRPQDEHTPLLGEALAQLIGTGEIVEDLAAGESCLFPSTIHASERQVAEGLIERVRGAQAPVDTAVILAAEAALGLTLENTQREAVAMALRESVCVITGGPGTGKTTITRLIVKILRDAGLHAMVCAPTGKAAKRASEAIGIEARTVHRTLEWKGAKPTYNAQMPLPCDVLLCDEMSMVDVPLFRAMLAALPPDAKLILIGDADQLPSVGPGKVLTDIIGSKLVPTTRLTEIFRQAQQSQIITSAHLVNRGDCLRETAQSLPPERKWYQRLIGEEDYRERRGKSDFRFFVFDDATRARDALLHAAREIWRHGYDPLRDVQVLVPMHAGPLGADQLNIELQRMLNPGTEGMPFRGGLLAAGDKVIQLRNNYHKEVFNGEIGYVAHLDAAERSVLVDFEGRSIRYQAAELDELKLAYALTIHRAQGSEFPVVLMGLSCSHYVMLKRNLLYTGMTRARKLMWLFGDEDRGRISSASRAARNSQIEERYSKLKDWLAEALVVGEPGSA